MPKKMRQEAMVLIQFNISLDDAVDVGDIIPNKATVFFNGIEGTTTNEIVHIVKDFIPPVALCNDSIEVSLDENGLAIIQLRMIDAGSSDNIGITLLEISETDFDCSNIGNNSITLIASDALENMDTCNTIIMIKDEIAPEITCSNINLVLIEGETQSITTTINDFSLIDNCSTSITVSANQTEFSYQDIGNNTITVSAEDENGNTNTCSINVNVEVATNILESQYGIKTTLSPNPMNDYVTLSFNKALPFAYNLNVVNAKGQIVRSYKNLMQPELRIEKKDLKGGLYFLQLKNRETNKIIANVELVIK